MGGALAAGAFAAAGVSDGLTNSKALLVLRALRRDIVAGVLKPGRKLSFGFLTGAYGVGVSPLREALCLLSAERLVVLESQRGFHVAPVSLVDLEDLIGVRRLIEIRALGLSIERGDGAWRRGLMEANAEFTSIAGRVGDQRPIDEAWQVTHRRYHFALIGACASPTLLHFCREIYDRFDRYRRLTIPAQSFMAGPARDHHAITAAATSGRREEAQALLERHIDDIAEVVVANFRPAV